MKWHRAGYTSQLLILLSLIRWKQSPLLCRIQARHSSPLFLFRFDTEANHLLPRSLWCMCHLQHQGNFATHKKWWVRTGTYSLCITKRNRTNLTWKHYHLTFVHALVIGYSFAKNSLCKRSTTIKTRLKCRETISPDRTKSRWISQFLTSCTNTWKEIATISSTLTISIDSNSTVVHSRWHRIVKHSHLSIRILYWHIRSDMCIMKKYTIYLIICLVLHGTWGNLLWSFNSAFKASSIWR